ncbi:multidrug ABC transporter permease [Corynebacterium pseudotuberculosis]|uniref:multidrug ABC transporter permease n=1 Tax=Corynebacterium pseudotuberculosis TaxID=1719 RepID=UPI000676E050|nr:multidrug ABC transporter permease [Corynebacterium pseudotuberculosis]AKS14174.1 ABC transporter [Corynebacterium pseudotuberculosis]
MFLNSIRAEWTKLRTTKAFWWTTALFIIFAVGFAALQSKDIPPGPLGIPIINPTSIVIGIQGLGILIIAIQAIMVVTSEYRHNYQSVTFLGTPNRTLVAISKWLMYAVFSALLTFIVVVLCFYTSKLVAGGDASKTLQVWNNESALRVMWVFPLIAALLVTFSQGMAYLLRQTAGVTTLMMIWILALEPLLGFLPKIGTWIAKYGPMNNMNAFLGKTAIQDIPWGYEGSGAYFAAWSFAILILGIIVLNKHDA